MLSCFLFYFVIIYCLHFLLLTCAPPVWAPLPHLFHIALVSSARFSVSPPASRALVSPSLSVVSSVSLYLPPDSSSLSYLLPLKAHLSFQPACLCFLQLVLRVLQVVRVSNIACSAFRTSLAPSVWTPLILKQVACQDYKPWAVSAVKDTSIRVSSRRAVLRLRAKSRRIKHIHECKTVSLRRWNSSGK